MSPTLVLGKHGHRSVTLAAREAGGGGLRSPRSGMQGHHPVAQGPSPCSAQPGPGHGPLVSMENSGGHVRPRRLRWAPACPHQSPSPARPALQFDCHHP